MRYYISPICESHSRSSTGIHAFLVFLSFSLGVYVEMKFRDVLLKIFYGNGKRKIGKNLNLILISDRRLEFHIQHFLLIEAQLPAFQEICVFLLMPKFNIGYYTMIFMCISRNEK